MRMCSIPVTSGRSASLASRHRTTAGTLMTAKAKVRRTGRPGSSRAIEESGELHTPHVFASLFEVGPPPGLAAETQGARSIHTADGECLDRVGRGEYRTAWGETFRSDDTDAP